jgi:hypothetical protein
MAERHPQQENDSTPARKPYSPPRILSREPLEAMALICRSASSKANSGACPRGPVNS